MKQRSSLPVYINDDLVHNRQIYDITDQIITPQKMTDRIVDKSLIEENEDRIRSNMKTHRYDDMSRMANNKIKSDMNLSRLVSSSVSRLKSHQDTSHVFNTKKTIRHVFLSLDSRYRDRSYRLSKGIRFNLSINQQSSTNGVIGLNYPLDHITEIELMNSIILPVTKKVDYPYINNTYSDEITIGIDEIKFQSYLGSTNNFHFCCKTTSINYRSSANRQLAMIPYTPVFKLQQPYNLDKNITLSFGSPDNNIGFNDDNYLVYVEYTNPAILTIYSNKIDI
jgi:hypothetical protein